MPRVLLTDAEKKEKVRLKNQAWYAKNKEKHKQTCKETVKIWYANNIEKRKEYYQQNKDHIYETQKKYYEANQETLREKQKLYYQKKRAEFDKVKKQPIVKMEDPPKKKKKIYLLEKIEN